MRPLMLDFQAFSTDIVERQLVLETFCGRVYGLVFADILLYVEVVSCAWYISAVAVSISPWASDFQNNFSACFIPSTATIARKLAS